MELARLLHQVQFDEKGGERTFAAVGSNGGNAQLVYFAKFGAAPGTGIRTEATDSSEPRPTLKN